MPGPLVLLGPQRPTANLRAALDALRADALAPRDGPIVVITAGWRHDEASDADLRRDVDPAARALPLYAAFDEVNQTAPELGGAYKERQSRVRKIKALYRMRLHPALAVVRRLFARLEDDPDLVRPVLDAAVATVRDIDEQFLLHSDAVHTAFDADERPDQHPEVASVRARAEALISEASAVVVAGGHVGVLRNRMAFFGMDEVLGLAHARGTPIVAWSAGAMALSERVILFHDDPPHGVGDPELLDRGLCVLEEVALFPHASQRLHLDEAPRIAALSRRFAPAISIGLDSGAMVRVDGDVLTSLGDPAAAYRFLPDGSRAPLPQGALDA